MAQYPLRLNDDLWSKFKSKVALEKPKKSMRAVLIRLLENYIKESEKEGEK